MPSSSIRKSNEQQFAQRWAIIGFVLAIAFAFPACVAIASPAPSPLGQPAPFLMLSQSTEEDSSVPDKEASPDVDSQETSVVEPTDSGEVATQSRTSFLSSLAKLPSGTWTIVGVLLALLVIFVWLMLQGEPTKTMDPPRKAQSNFQKTDRFKQANQENEDANDADSDRDANLEVDPASTSTSTLEQHSLDDEFDTSGDSEESSLDLFTDFGIDPEIDQLDDSGLWLPPSLSDSSHQHDSLPHHELAKSSKFQTAGASQGSEGWASSGSPQHKKLGTSNKPLSIEVSQRDLSVNSEADAEKLLTELDLSRGGVSFIVSDKRNTGNRLSAEDIPVVAAAPAQLISSEVVDRNRALTETLNDQQGTAQSDLPDKTNKQLCEAIAAMASDFGIASEEPASSENALAQLAGLKNNIHSFRNENLTLHGDVDALKERLAVLEDDVQSLERESSELRNENLEQSNALKQLQVDHDTLIEQRDELRSLLEASKIANSVLESQVATLTDSLSEAGVPDLNRLMSQLNEQLAEETRKRHQSDQMLTQAEEQRNVVASELRRLRNVSADLQEKTELQKITTERHESDREAWKQRENELARITDELRSSNDASSNEVNDLLGERDTLELTIKEKSRQHELVQNELTTAKSQIAELKAAQADLETANADLAARLDDLNQKSGEFTYAQMERTLGTVAEMNVSLIRSQEYLSDLNAKLAAQTGNSLTVEGQRDGKIRQTDQASVEQRLQQMDSVLASYRQAQQENQAELEQLRKAQQEILEAVRLIPTSRQTVD